MLTIAAKPVGWKKMPFGVDTCMTPYSIQSRLAVSICHHENEFLEFNPSRSLRFVADCLSIPTFSLVVYFLCELIFGSFALM